MAENAERLSVIARRAEELAHLPPISIQAPGVAVGVDPSLVARGAYNTNRGVLRLLNELARVCLIDDHMTGKVELGEGLADLLARIRV